MLKRLKFGSYPVNITELKFSEQPLAFLLHKTNIYSQILLLIAKALNVAFDFQFVPMEFSLPLLNGSWTGSIGTLKRNELDLAVISYGMIDQIRNEIHYCYPFRIYHFSFVTGKPEYVPKVFGILGVFSFSLWIAIVTALMSLVAVYFALLKQEYSFGTIFLHVFAVFLRQSGILKQTKFSEKLLSYSWVVGAMIVCLAFESVVLSFLAFPPLSVVKDVASLARAVEDGDYRCMASDGMTVIELLLESEEEKYRAVGQNVLENFSVLGRSASTFISESKLSNKNKKKIAYILNTHYADLFSGKYFISEDRFGGTLAAMMARKDFCCKEKLDMTVHRIVSSGIYKKIYKDYTFHLRLRFFSNYTESEPERKVTLTQVAPAFIFLWIGCGVSLFIVILELIFNSFVIRVHVENYNKRKKTFLKVKKFKLLQCH